MSLIVIIDDNADFVKIAKRCLLSIFPGAEVKWFQYLADARSALQSDLVDRIELVILDQHLADGNGVSLLSEGIFGELAVLVLSSDSEPSLPGAALGAGASFFLLKTQMMEPLFEPLVRGLIQRNRMLRELVATRVNASTVDTVKRLVKTLEHEINNPLGAVLGAAYVLREHELASPDRQDAVRLVEESAQRIKHVISQLGEACSLETVKKGPFSVFSIPGDPKWSEQTSEIRPE
jgi:signal transduction histidine kinase